MLRAGVRAAAIGSVALAVTLGAVGLQPAAAGTDRGMCSADESRGKIPDDFPLLACFDGKKLIIHNTTNFPLMLRANGDGVGTPRRYTHGSVDAVSMLLSGVESDEHNLVPPDFYAEVSIGEGAAQIHVGTADARYQKAYLLAESIWKYLPAGEEMKVVYDLFAEIDKVSDKYTDCKNSNNAWGDVRCSVVLGRDVAFAFGRAALNGLGTAVVQSVVGLIETANWANAATGDLMQLKDGTRDFTINKYTPPAPPAPPTSQPPQSSTGGTGGGNSGNGSGGGGNSNSNSNPNPQPKSFAAVVQNKHLGIPDGLVEDSSASYLSGQMVPKCAANGCKVDGTDMWSGDTFTATCWNTGALITNENRNTAGDDNNPNKIETDRWLYGTRNGRSGYISYVYVTPDTRSQGDALSHC